MIDTTNKSAEKLLTGLQKLTMRLSSMRKRKGSVSFARSASSLNSGDNSALATPGLMRQNSIASVGEGLLDVSLHAPA